MYPLRAVTGTPAARPFAEDPADRPGLGQVGDDRRGAVGVDVADLVGRRAWRRGGPPGWRSRCRRPSGSSPPTGAGVAARAEAEDLAVDPGPAGQGVLALLEDQDARPLAGDPAVAGDVERPAGPRGLAPPVRHLVEQAHPDQAQRVDLGVGPAGDHHVGPAPGDDPGGLADRHVRGRLGLGDRVARPLAVEQDRDVAGQHVRQVLQEPDRRDLADPLAAVGVVVERAVGLEAGVDRRGQLVQLGRDQAGAEVHADPGRVDPAVDQPGVEDGQLGRGDRELDVAGHVLQALADRLPEPGDGQVLHRLVVEVGDLAADVVGQAVDGEGPDLADGPPALGQRRPERLDPDAQRRDEAQSGDDHSSFGTGHGVTRPSPPRSIVANGDRSGRSVRGGLSRRLGSTRGR